MTPNKSFAVHRTVASVIYLSVRVFLTEKATSAWESPAQGRFLCFYFATKRARTAISQN
jgi:hypothetical protein